MEIGDKFKTKQGNVLEVKESTGKFRSNGAEIYILECDICSKEDSKLWFYGSITSDKYSLKRGQNCCGCSKKPTYTREQWKIRLERKCDERGYKVIDYGELKNKNSKVKIYNPVTGNVWETVLHYLINQGKCDPWLYNMQRSDSYHIQDFYNTGLREDYEFVRSDSLDSQGKRSMWEVYCPVCDETYTRRHSDLKRGKVPCDCKKGGYNISSAFGFFYVLKILVEGEHILKFGITSVNPKRRWQTLISANKINSLEVNLLIKSTDAEVIRDCETRLKKIFRFELGYLNRDQFPDGYTETMKWSEESLDKIRNYLTFHLPCPAIKHGKRSLQEVLPLIESLPDNVFIYVDK